MRAKIDKNGLYQVSFTIDNNLSFTRNNLTSHSYLKEIIYNWRMRRRFGAPLWEIFLKITPTT